MRQWLSEVSQHITIARWVVIFALAGLFTQSLLFPLELVHTYHLSMASVWGCLVMSSRDFDIFVARAWIPYPILLGVVLLHPIMAQRSG